MIGATVTTLQPEPSLRRLDVLERGLRVHRKTPVAAADHPVPGSKVALDGQWDLGRPAQAQMEARPKPLEHGVLGAISDGVSSRIGAQGQIQAGYGAPRSHVGHRYMVELAAFEAKQSLVGSARGRADVAQAQPRRDASHSVVAPEPPHRLGRSPAAAIVGTFPGSHGGMMAPAPYLPVNIRMVRLSDQRANDTPGSVRSAGLSRRTVPVADYLAKERDRIVSPGPRLVVPPPVGPLGGPDAGRAAKPRRGE